MKKPSIIEVQFTQLVINPAWGIVKQRAKEIIEQAKTEMFAAEDQGEAEKLRLKVKYETEFWESIEHLVSISATKTKRK